MSRIYDNMSGKPRVLYKLKEADHNNAQISKRKDREWSSFLDRWAKHYYDLCTDRKTFGLSSEKVKDGGRRIEFTESGIPIIIRGSSPAFFNPLFGEGVNDEVAVKE